MGMASLSDSEGSDGEFEEGTWSYGGWGAAVMWQPRPFPADAWQGLCPDGTPIVRGGGGNAGVLLEAMADVVEDEEEEEDWTAVAPPGVFGNGRELQRLPPVFRLNSTEVPANCGLPIPLRARVSSTAAELRWRAPEFQRPMAGWHYQLDVSSDAGPEKQSIEASCSQTALRIRLKPGHWYLLQISALHESGRLLAWGGLKVRSIFSREELGATMERAERLLGRGMEQFGLFYRNKPDIYWRHINHNRMGLMEKYLKDKNGHSAAPLNDVIEGLFFNGKLLHGAPPTKSPFGEVRMDVAAWRLFTPAHRLYFADFYCNTSMHYVTVLLTTPNSEADRYAREFLIPLDVTANPFLRVAPQGQGRAAFYINASPSAWVEVFYTDNLHLRLAEGWAECLGQGRSTPGGLRHNAACGICNLPADEEKSLRNMPAAEPILTMVEAVPDQDYDEEEEEEAEEERMKRAWAEAYAQDDEDEEETLADEVAAKRPRLETTAETLTKVVHAPRLSYTLHMEISALERSLY